MAAVASKATIRLEPISSVHLFFPHTHTLSCQMYTSLQLFNLLRFENEVTETTIGRLDIAISGWRRVRISLWERTSANLLHLRNIAVHMHDL